MSQVVFIRANQQVIMQSRDQLKLYLIVGQNAAYYAKTSQREYTST